MISYRAPSTSTEVLLTDNILDHISAHRQKKLWAKEAGGQLFGRFWNGAFIVHVATGPRPADRRSRWSFQPDPTADQQEVNKMHAVGLHYLGTWHTHPQRRPMPSKRDVSTMEHTFSNATHELSGFLMLVVGTDDPPNGLYLGMVTRGGTTVLLPMVRDLSPSLSAWGANGVFATLPRIEKSLPPYQAGGPMK